MKIVDEFKSLTIPRKIALIVLIVILWVIYFKITIDLISKIDLNFIFIIFFLTIWTLAAILGTYFIFLGAKIMDLKDVIHFITKFRIYAFIITYIVLINFFSTFAKIMNSVSNLTNIFRVLDFSCFGKLL